MYELQKVGIYTHALIYLDGPAHEQPIAKWAGIYEIREGWMDGFENRMADDDTRAEAGDQ
ncbi:hypothetical protein [Microvirga antarctica]|uniref:hypothetical protein n=1 Tax=Microvirga antarctica TaxID=2819233 RepID=UPI001B3015C6|nr:hypothetical protein [Microvirga antarctica]